MNENLLNLKDDVERHARAFQSRHLADAPVIFEALIAAEDHRARKHNGVDWLSIARAVILAPCERGVRGVSTIEQQLVRTLMPRTRRHIRGKLEELYLAHKMGRFHTKQELCAAYLHAAYYGPAQNYDSVRNLYCGTDSELTTEAAAQIVALLKYPLSRGGSSGSNSVQKRRASHIESLQSDGFPPLGHRIAFRIHRCWKRWSASLKH